MPPPIHLLESNPQKRGDLFCRLLADYFHSLGYGGMSFNVNKTGREVDILGRHRTESRRLVAEAKATKRLVGGDAINKFVGTLDAERRQYTKIDTVGYFVSLTGFTASARQQEEEAGGTRVVLVTGESLLDELIRSRVVPRPEEAAAEAGRLVSATRNDLHLDEHLELVAHEMGWVWAVRFRRTGNHSAVALIHADGEPLGGDVAEQILAADRKHQGLLTGLDLLQPSATGLEQRAIEDAQESYHKFLTLHCGEIRFDGLPADGDMASRGVPIEELFVPLRLKKILFGAGSAKTVMTRALEQPSQPEWADTDALTWLKAVAAAETGRWGVGEVLGTRRHIAILAPPGSGKTTLLKRLATAYSFPTRRSLVEDELPDEAWFPILLRCRQLGELARLPLRQVLFALPRLGDFHEHDAAFRTLVQEKLRNGNALVLLDGLDEIKSEGDRRWFVESVRTFLTTYPQVRLVLTSREPGFRMVAGVLGETCEVYSLAELNEDDVKRFVNAWYRQVGGPNAERERAAWLVASILANDRIRRLAASPLLLTTLLLVERWLGELPTRRSVLYGEAINVLLRTWNVQAHEPMALDEAVPQLAYVAFVMMERGVQQLSQPQLREVLRQARRQMEDILGRARLPISEFVQRVELRSSLLVEAGFSDEEGRVVPVYEFRHLTFQEYLAALAMVERFLPTAHAEAPLSEVIAPHLLDETWSEVIPLVAVLADRRDAPQLVSGLTERLELAVEKDALKLSEPEGVSEHRAVAFLKTERTYWQVLEHVRATELLQGVPPQSWVRSSLHPVHQVALLVARCLADEVKVAPTIIRRALFALLSVPGSETNRGPIALLAGGSYGKELRDLTLEELFSGGPNTRQRFVQLAAATPLSEVRDNGESGVEKILGSLASEKRQTQLLGLASCYGWCASAGRASPTTDQARLLLRGLAECRHNEDPLVLGGIVTVLLAWARAGWLLPDAVPVVLPTLIQAWLAKLPFGSADDCAKVIVNAPVPEPGCVELNFEEGELSAFLQEEVEKGGVRKLAALAVGYTRGAPWNQTELRSLLEENQTSIESSPIPESVDFLSISEYRLPLGRRLLAALGDEYQKDSSNQRTLPAIPLRDLVVPARKGVLFIVGRTRSLGSAREALAEDCEIYLAYQSDPSVDEPHARDLCTTGTVARITNHVKLGNGNWKLAVQGLYRARLVRFFSSGEAYHARVERLRQDHVPPEPSRLRSRLEVIYERYARESGLQGFPEQTLPILALEDPSLLSLAVMNSLERDLALRQNVLEAENPWQQWELLLAWLENKLTHMRRAEA